MNPKEIDAVQALKLETPSTIRKVRKLLGFLGYYRLYINDFARIVKPIYDLSTKPATCKMKGARKTRNCYSLAPPSQPAEWTGRHQDVRGSSFWSCQAHPLWPTQTLKSPTFKCLRRRARRNIIPTSGWQTKVSGF